MDANRRKEMMENVNKAESMNQILDVVNSYYDFDTKIGAGSKGVVTMGLQKVIKMCKIEERETPLHELGEEE